MLRAILSAIIVVALLIVTLAVGVIAKGARDDVRLSTADRVQASAEAIKLSNDLAQQQFAMLTSDASLIPDLVMGLRCPRSGAELRALSEPVIDPATGQPQRDSSGRPVLRGAGLNCPNTQHDLVLGAVQRWADALPDDAPDLVVVADRSGEVVARTGSTMRDWFGETKPNMASYPVVGRTEEFGTQRDVIVWRDHETAPPAVALVAASPVFRTRSSGAREYLGSVLMGDFVNNLKAETDQYSLSGSDIVYFAIEDGSPLFPGSTLEGDAAFVDSLAVKQYEEVSLTDGGVSATKLDFNGLINEGAGRAFSFESGGSDYYAMPGRFNSESSADAGPAGFLVLTSLTEALAPVNKFKVVGVIATVLALISIFIVIVAVRMFLKPADEISRGVQEVIAGNKNFMWPVEKKSYFSDLAHSLNIMSARLQGKPDPDSEDAAGAREWQGMVGGPGKAKQRPAGGNQPVGGLGNLRGRSSQNDEE